MPRRLAEEHRGHRPRVEIAGLYGELSRMQPSPVVELNRAVAVAMADGPAAGCAIVEQVAATVAMPSLAPVPRREPTFCAASTRHADAGAAAYARHRLAQTAPSGPSSNAACRVCEAARVRWNRTPSSSSTVPGTAAGAGDKVVTGLLDDASPGRRSMAVTRRSPRSPTTSPRRQRGRSRWAGRAVRAP